MDKERSIRFIRDWISSVEAKPATNEGASVAAPAPAPTRETPPPPVAITGLSGSFPGSSDVSAFWEGLEREEPLTITIPQERFDWEALYDPTGTRPNTMRTKWGGFIPDIVSFDPGLFRILPAEADEMDPRQRMLLMSTWHTLADAGIPPLSLRQSNTGVFIAGETNEYLRLMKRRGVKPRGLFDQEDSLIANRISYHFGWLGPSEYVNTMCSGFAVALHRAVAAVRNGEIDRAIVGAANLILLPDRFIALSEGGQMSTQQLVKSFGKDGDGYLSSEGVGTILIEKQDDARVARRRIYANIKHTAVNHNGAGGMSIATPNTAAHIRLIKDCYQAAGIDPRRIRYIEAQGMGLPVADIAEWTALNRALTELTEAAGHRVEPGYCRVSTLKPMIGHMHAASALGALLKIIHSFQSNRIYPVIGFEEPNEYCDMSNSPCRIVAESETWEPDAEPRLAALHAYGSGGNNAHIVVEETATADRFPPPSLTPEKLNPVRCWFEAAEESAAPTPATDQATVPTSCSPASAEEIVRRLVAPLLKSSEADVPLNGRLRDLGFTSLNIVSLSEGLQRDYGIAINPATFYEFFCLKDLAAHLASEWEAHVPGRDRTPQREAVRERETEDIAIIGMSGVFPGARNLDEFWQNLMNGVDCIREVPADRWDWRAWEGNPAEGNKTDCKWGGFIQNHDTFDPLFFNISPREAGFMDPQIRKILEEIWHAIEDSGYSPNDLSGRKVGLFIGVSTGEYQALWETADPEDLWNTSTSGLASLGLARISDFLNFKGPIDVVETACSSSLAAVHKGVNSIKMGDCDIAIVGGGHLMLTPIGHISLRKAGAICSDGRSKSFSSSADGYGRGEGIGVVLLESASAAQSHRISIYARIKGSAINHDGRSSSLTAPNPASQAAVIREAQARAGIQPNTITYVEAHGTGTPLGDPIEIEGLKKAFGSTGSNEAAYCAVGSVKSHIGHLEIAAGISGLIKTVLQLKHAKLAGTLNLDQLNEHIEIERTPFYIPIVPKEWLRKKDAFGQTVPLRAGVSAFGLSGVNVHVVLEEDSQNGTTISAATTHGKGLFVLSAKTSECLHQYATEMLQFLQRTPDIGFADFLYTLQIGRKAMEERLAIPCVNSEQLQDGLAAFLDQSKGGKLFHRGNTYQDVSSTADARKLDGWILESNWEALAELWVKGHEIHWSKTPGSDSRQRMAGIPGYPFEREKYWVGNAAAMARPLKESGRNGSDHEVMTFEERWEAKAWSAEREQERQAGGVMVCFLSDPKHQATLQKLAGSTQLIFVTEGASDHQAEVPIYSCVPTETNAIQNVLARITAEHAPIDEILYGWALSDPAYCQDYFPIVSLIQAIKGFAVAPRKLLFAGVPTNEVEGCHLESWHGFVSSLGRVISRTAIGLVILEAADTGLGTLWDEWQLECLSTVRYRSGQRQALKIRPTQPRQPVTNAYAKGTILITGGAGALGLIFAEYLAAQARQNQQRLRLVLMGRSQLTPEKQARIENMAGGAATYLQVDISNAEATKRAIARISREADGIQGVVHAAGVADERTLFEKEFEAFQAVLAPKINGTMALDEALSNEPLEFIVYFSSAAAIVGDFGSCDYAVGNRFEMAWADHYNQRVARGERSGKAHVINWPYWSDGGMRIGDDAQTEFYLMSSGLRGLEAEEGCRVFDAVLGLAAGQHLVMVGRRDRVFHTLGLAEAPAAQKKDSRPIGIENSAALSDLPLENRVENDLLTLVEHHIGIPRQRLNIKTNLTDFGFDSINLTGFAARLTSHFGVEVTPAVFFGHSTIARLTGFFVNEHRDVVAALYDSGRDSGTDSELMPIPSESEPMASEKVGAHRLESIAIIGRSGRFPEARDVEELWHVLESGKNCVSPLPNDPSVDRPDWPKHTDPEQAVGESFYSGLIPGIEEFDPLFFEISPREAELMDPRQRQLLQECWKALEDAGYGETQVEEHTIGIFVGVEESHYQIPPEEPDLTGNHNAILASRLAYFLNLGGPVMAINTACSSSLVALHQAVLSLRGGECDTAIVAGANLIPNMAIFKALTKAGMLSPDGKCRAFDRRANGMVPGEAVAAVVLKRLSLAEADNDPIQAVIRGSNINYDGKTNGITAPSTTAQEALLKAAYLDNKLDLERVGYIVTHGTGTSLGDMVEINGLANALKLNVPNGSCALTSTKTNLGHTFAASGIVSLISMVEALKRRQIPASLHCSEESEGINWDVSPFYVNKTTTEWRRPFRGGRLGGVSAFGMSGTNAHVVLEEFNAPSLDGVRPPSYYLLPLSAKSQDALRAKVNEMVAFLVAHPLSAEAFASFCFTLQHGRHHFAWRQAIVVRDAAEALQVWEQCLSQKSPPLFEGKIPLNFKADAAKVRQAQELASQCQPLNVENCRAHLENLAVLYCEGVPIEWQLLYDDRPPKKMSLPGYPFQRTEYWIDQQAKSSLSATQQDGSDEPYALQYFEESWQTAEDCSPLTANGARDVPQVIVCFLADEKKREEFLSAVLANEPDSEVVFVSPSEREAASGTNRYQVKPTEVASYRRTLQAIADRFQRLDTLVYLWSADGVEWNRTYQPVVALLQAVEACSLTARRVCLAGFIREPLDQAYLDSWHGFKMSLRQTLPKTQINLVMVDSDPDVAPKKNWAVLIDEALNSSSIASAYYCRGVRHELQIVPKVLEENPERVIDPARGTILITGGCGGIGLHIARHLAERARMQGEGINLILGGRSPLTGAKQVAVAELKELGCNVAYLQANVGDEEGMVSRLKTLTERFGPIRGVIHAAGVTEGGNLFGKSFPDFQEVLHSKVSGTLVLDEALKDEPLEFFCCFSSLSAVVGDFGSADYAVGNRFQMAFSRHRNQLVTEGKRQGKSLVINWPLWADGGMGLGAADQTEFYLKTSGQRALSSVDGVRVFDLLLRQAGSQYLVIHGQKSRVHRFLGLARSAPTPAAPDNRIAASVVVGSGRTREMTGLSLGQCVMLDLRKRVSQLMKLADETLDPEENLANYGFDSISLGELAKELSSHFGFEITTAVFFSHPNLAALEGYLLDAHAEEIAAFYQDAVAAKTPSEPIRPVTQAPKPKSTLPNEEFTSALSVEPIAIIGRSGRFPEAGSVAEMWAVLEGGRDAVKEIPADRFDWREYFGDPKVDATKTNCKWSGLIPGIDEFDRSFFDISEREAKLMDPRQRHLLQESWRALEDAGVGPDGLESHKIGVFVGVEESSYMPIAAGGSLTANHSGVLAARLSYFLNLRGPALAINTACSSGLVALHQAILSLRSKECDLAIVAGAHLMPNPDVYVALTQAGLLSPDGRCAAFDNGANGMAPGESVAVLVLKRRSLAERDLDTIHALIRGSGINYDGKTNGIAAPSGASQVELLNAVYEKHHIDPAAIDYLVAHGTGTKLGDSIEVMALTDVFKAHGHSGLALTSPKGNFGHTFAASGLVGVINLIEAMNHECIPASLHCREDSDYIQWKASPCYVNKVSRRWERQADKPRMGATSSFGMSGTNAHVVVEEYEHSPNPPGENPPCFILPLSAKTEVALRQRVQDMLAFLKSGNWSADDLVSISYTLQIGRHSFSRRCAIVAVDVDDAIFLWRTMLADKPNARLFHGTVPKAVKLQAAIDQAARDMAMEASGLHSDTPRFQDIANALADLYCQGYRIHWESLYGDLKPMKRSLPTYPFATERYWITPEPADVRMHSGNGKGTTPAPRQGRIEWAFSLDSTEVSSNLPGPKFTVSEKAEILVRQSLASELHISADAISMERPFNDCGLTSIDMTKVIQQLSGTLDEALHPSLLVEYFTGASFAAYLGERYEDAIERLRMHSLPATTSSNGKNGAHPSQSKMHFPELVHLNAETAGRPVFWFHAGLGGVQPYCRIAQNIHRPFHGIQARGWRTGFDPITGIDAMAAYYIRIIQSLQPQGPYDFGGYSLGSLIAYEVTRQLQEKGQTVSSIVMIDAPDPEHLKVMEVSPKSELLQSVNYALATKLMLEPERITDRLIHRDTLDTTGSTDKFLGQLTARLEENGRDEYRDLAKTVRHMVAVQRAYAYRKYSFSPLPEPEAVHCSYLRNTSGLFFGEMAPYYMIEKDLSAWDHNDYISAWQQRLPHLQIFDLDAANHVMLLSDPKVVDAITTFCQQLYEN